MKKVLKVVIILIVMLAALNYSYIKYEEIILKREMKDLTKLNITKDSFNTTIKTNGNYSKVEYAIKTYIIDYNKKLNELDILLNNKKIYNILSASNYQEDKGEFINSYSYLDSYKSSIDVKYNELIKISAKKYIRKYIEKEELNKYYEDLFDKYMFNTTIYREIKSTNKEYQDSINNIYTLIDKEKEVLDFLKTTNWIIKDNNIMFNNDEDLAKYNSLVANL